MQNLVGVDIGGTKCAVVLGRIPGDDPRPNRLGVSDITIVDKISFPTPVSAGYESALERIQSTIEEIVSRNGLRFEDLTRIGISCGGPLDSKRGIIMSPPIFPAGTMLRSSGFWRIVLESRLHCRTMQTPEHLRSGSLELPGDTET